MGAELIVSPPDPLSLSPLDECFGEGEGSVTGVTVTLLKDDRADMAAAATSLWLDLTLRSREDDCD